MSEQRDNRPSSSVSAPVVALQEGSGFNMRERGRQGTECGGLTASAMTSPQRLKRASSKKKKVISGRRESFLSPPHKLGLGFTILMLLNCFSLLIKPQAKIK